MTALWSAARALAGGVISALTEALDRVRRRAAAAKNEREHAEAVLIEAGALQRAIFNSANFSSIATDAKGIIQIFNVGAERMLGYAAVDVVNKITPADISDRSEVIARAKSLSLELETSIEPGFEALAFKASRGIEDIYELTYIRKDGSRFPAVVSVTALRNAEDAIIGYLIIGTDNTARQRAEESRRASEGRYRALFECAPDGIVITDPDGYYIDANAGMCRMLGYTRDEFLGLHSSEIVSEPEAQHIRAALASSKGHPQYEREWQFQRKDGSVFLAEVIASKMPDGNLLAMTHDITERKVLAKQIENDHEELEQRLRDQQFYTRSLIESDIDALITTDALGVITDVNKQMEALTGSARDELVGAPFKSYFTDPERAEAGIKLALSQNKVTNCELRALGRHGKQTAVSYNATTFHDRDGKLQGVFVAARDITERERHEASLIEVTHKAEQASRVKSEFLANMSHEIRTPMNAVIGLSYLLGRTGLDAEQAALLDKIKLASKSLTAVINDVLDLSKIEAGELMVERAAFSPHRLLRELGDVMAVQADTKGIGFEVDTPLDLPVALSGDALRLGQILTNLLSNAIKFTERGGVKLTVRRGASASHGLTLCFAVKDTGIGIAPDVQSRLFAPFSQADTSITRRFGGTGLGLSIVKRLTSLLGGEVGFDSTEGTGSEFRVTLDFALASPEALAAREAAPAAAEERALSGVRVLVVDDSCINLDVTRRILELRGAEVSLSNNGREAFERLQAEPETIDVVLMDVQMPVLDGHDATRRIRLELGLVDLPIIALTAGALSSERQRAADAGMNDFIVKPFDAEALVRRILVHAHPAGPELTPKVAGEPELGQPVLGWPELKGIDVSDARSRFGHDLDLFASMLRRLLDEFSDLALPPSATDPRTLAAQAKRMHKLRGAAGTLGAKALAELATRAEAAWMAGELDRAASLVAPLASELQRLQEDTLPMLQAERPQKQAASSPAPGELDPVLLVDLIELLRQQNLCAQDRFNAISPQLRQRLGQESYDLALHHMARLQFSDALKLLEKSSA